MPVPPPVYNFAAIPTVAHRDPLWDEPGLAEAANAGEGFLAGAPREVRETLGTSLRAGSPEQVIRLSGSSWTPLVAALTLTVVLALFIAKLYLFAALAFLTTLAVLLRWCWTTGDPGAPERIDAGPSGAGRLMLPTQAAHRHAPGYTGTAIFLLVDASLFASLVFAYFYLWLHAPQWPPQGASLPAITWPALGLLLLAGSSLAAQAATRANARRHAGPAQQWVLLSGGLMAGFLVLQAVIVAGMPAPQTHAWASVTQVIVGFHAVHGVVCMLMAGYLWLRIRHGLVDATRNRDFRVVTLFWHCTVAMGCIAAVLVFLFPRWS